MTWSHGIQKNTKEKEHQTVTGICNQGFALFWGIAKKGEVNAKRAPLRDGVLPGTTGPTLKPVLRGNLLQRNHWVERERSKAGVFESLADGKNFGDEWVGYNSLNLHFGRSTDWALAQNENRLSGRTYFIKTGLRRLLSTQNEIYSQSKTGRNKGGPISWGDKNRARSVFTRLLLISCAGKRGTGSGRRVTISNKKEEGWGYNTGLSFQRSCPMKRTTQKKSKKSSLSSWIKSGKTS